MATPSKASLAKLVTLLTGMPERAVLNQMNTWSSEQFAGLVSSVAAFLTPDAVFPTASMAQLAIDRDDLYNEAEAIAYAATQLPEDVFTGDDAAKLGTWALANGYIADPG